jgi:hypothetical protein
MNVPTSVRIAMSRQPHSDLARRLRGLSEAELERLALDPAYDERTLWAVHDVLARREGSSARMITQRLRERLMLGGVPVRTTEPVIWSQAVSTTRRRGRFGVAGLFAGVVIVGIAVFGLYFGLF